MLDLSVCSIVRDEEGNIGPLAACIPLGEVEWVVVDTGSRDATVTLLRQAGITPHAFAWRDNFAAARNFSLERATRGWILWLDADDRLDAAFWQALAPLLSGPRRAYRFVVRSPREGSRGDCFRQIRLFPNRMGLAFEGRIHEQLGTSLRRLGLEAAEAGAEAEILHLGYDSAAKREAKLRRNRALLEKERVEHPRDPSVGMEYGNCLYQAGDYAGAREAYLRFLPGPDPLRCGEAPADEVSRHFPILMAETETALKDVAAAERWFRLALRWTPSELKPYYWLGKQALARNEIRAALELLYQAIDQPVKVGKVATDNATVRRNAMALVVLCEMQLLGAADAVRAAACLRELTAGGLEDFPLDARVPFEFYRDTGDLASLQAYALAYLAGHPEDVPMWEDFLEQLLAAGRHAGSLACMEERPDLAGRSGTLAAFRGRSLEASGADTDTVYAVYKQSLIRFPEDPTLLVYFSEFVNHNRLWSRCYADLKAIPKPNETVREFLRQLEAQGVAARGKAP